MNSKNKGLAEISFKDLMDSLDESDEIMIETRLIMYKFLSEIDKITSERGINRKQLAKLAGTSPSYITQLYQGKKIISLQLLARIKTALNIDFKIKAIPTEPKRKSGYVNLTAVVGQKMLPKSKRNVAAVATHSRAGLIKKTGDRTMH